MKGCGMEGNDKGKRVHIMITADDLYEMDNDPMLVSEQKRRSAQPKDDSGFNASGAMGGAASGASAGAALGSVIPGIGNVAGAIGGALLGGALGGFGGGDTAQSAASLGNTAAGMAGKPDKDGDGKPDDEDDDDATA